LIRARAIAGDHSCMLQFEQLRKRILSRPRDPNELKREVSKMRMKMTENLDHSTATTFDLKQGPGGITEIEFIIQYLVLRWANDYPQLLEPRSVLRLLKIFTDCQLLDSATSEQLGEAYRAYRAETHRLALQNQPALVNHDKFALQRQQVRHWWEQLVADQT